MPGPAFMLHHLALFSVLQLKMLWTVSVLTFVTGLSCEGKT